MTFQQLRLVSEIASRGSVSSAAKALRLSQSNASQSLKKLEEELGYSIFIRSEGGMLATEQGTAFLRHAKIILREQTAILSPEETVSPLRLRLGIMNFTPAMEAFVRFCGEVREARDGDLSCLNLSPENGVQLLKERMLDLIVSLQLKSTMPLAEKLCRENQLELQTHAVIPVCARVRREHPLLVSGKLDGTNASLKKLAQYPYVEYKELNHILPSLVPMGGSPFGYSYRIFTDERESRLSLVGATDAYTVGCQLSAEQCERYGLACIPIKNEFSTLTTFTLRGGHALSGVRRYLEILNELVQDRSL